MSVRPPEDERGPIDAQYASRGSEALNSDTPTAGGVKANASNAHLLEAADKLDVRVGAG